MVVELVESFHGVVDLPGGHASGGNLMMSRFKAIDEKTAFFASHDQVYRTQLEYPEESTIEWKAGRQGEHISVQVPIEKVTTTALLEKSLGGSEGAHIEAIDTATTESGEVRIAHVDNVGTVRMTNMPLPSSDTNSSTGEAPTTKRQKTSDSSSSSSSPSSTSVTTMVLEGQDKEPRQEAGWNGIALHPTLNRLWTASYWSKELRHFEDGRLVRSVHAALSPHCIQIVKDGPAADCVAVAENNVVSLWDFRASERSGCVQRLQNSTHDIYCLDTAGSSLVASGEEKTVFVYDLRKNKLVGQWIKALKYEVMSVLLSTKDPSMVYATGLDHEVFCGSWKKSDNLNTLKRHGFRGESRWIGMDLVPGSDSLLGLTENCHLYALRHPYRLAVPK
jgi:hypothetical protein